MRTRGVAKANTGRRTRREVNAAVNFMTGDVETVE